MIVGKEFYEISAIKSAKLIVGKILCRREGDIVRRARITETECYCGENDTACHASKGRTNRTEVLYRPGGIAYVYLCYGLHNLLNIVTGSANNPEAVLIRGVEGANGPGKLTKMLGIDRSLNGVSFIDSNVLWLEDDNLKYKICSGKRIGIDYATEEYREKEWRFYIDNK